MSVAEHDLLLRATLGPDDTARDAYERWRAQADLATIDRASQRVLALLAERLGDQRDDAVAAKVQRIARFTWLRTQVLLERATPAVRRLTESGVPVMLIKGAAVLAHTGWRVARRPMDDSTSLSAQLRHAGDRGAGRLRLRALVRPHPRAPRRDPRDGLP